jgi:hypothetical protein
MYLWKMDMSKYEPLQRHLASQPGREVPMTFQQIEKVLGFHLPESARVHRPWWSNNIGSHVNAAAWRKAGWRTAQVDLGAEKVTFVKEEASPLDHERGEAVGRQTASARIEVPLAVLSRTALRLVDDIAEERGCDRASAVAMILDGYAIEQRRRLLRSFSGEGPKTAFDSVAAIREDRDAR